MQSLSVKILFFRFLKAGLLAGCRAKSVQDNIIVDPQFFCQNRPYHHSRRKNDNIIRRNNIPSISPSIRKSPDTVTFPDISAPGPTMVLTEISSIKFFFAILLFCVGSFYIQIFNRIYDIGTDMHFIM